MKTTVQWLDAVKERLDLQSDYAAAKYLGVTRSTVSAWRNGKQTFDDYACFRIADTLGLNPFEVVAAVNIERARDDERKAMWLDAWEKISKGFQKLALPANACWALVPQV